MGNPSLTLPKRGPGAPKGNQNALKHGWTTRSARALRWQRWETLQAEWREREARSAEWIASRRQACDAQHARILAELARERAERALTDPENWAPCGL
jgi:hypothetical protein